MATLRDSRDATNYEKVAVPMTVSGEYKTTQGLGGPCLDVWSETQEVKNREMVGLPYWWSNN
jgi:hypothetical protein